MYQLRQLNLMLNNLFANYWRPLLISLAILMWMWWLFAPVLHAAPMAQAPFNNANTYIINIDAGPMADIVSNVGETFGSVSLLTKNVAYVALFQDLAAAAKGTILIGPDGTLITRPAGPEPIPDTLLAAVLAKHGVVKVFDGAGVQIFP